MARQVLPKTANSGSSPTVSGAALTFTAADTVNFDQFALTGHEVLLIWNTHATNAGTYTLNSVADNLGRTGDITAFSIAAGVIHAFGPMSLIGWQQTDGTLHLAASAATMKYAIYTIPG